MALVERMQTHMIGLVNAYIDRLMRALEPELRARFDAKDIPDGVFKTGQVDLGAGFLRAVFHAVDAQAASDLGRVIPVPSAAVLPNARKLEQTWVRNNTDLIKLEERARREVEKIVTDPLRQGQRVEQIRTAIEQRLGVVRSRAELIARDQTLKLYGRIQQERQEAAGIVEYVWSTSEDERVRPDHQDLDGTTQRWDTPPIVDKRTGRREHPGADYQCRCAAVPVLETAVDEPFAQQPADEPLTAPTPEPPEAERPTVPVVEAPIDFPEPREFFPDFAEMSEAQVKKIHPSGISTGPRSPEYEALNNFLTGHFATIRALQSGATVEQILANPAVFGTLERAEVLEVKAMLAPLARAQEIMAIDNPTKHGALFRGLNVSQAALDEILTGSSIEFTAASNSASYNFDIARQFATAQYTPGQFTPARATGRVVLRFQNLDRGTPVGFRANVNAYEMEVIVGGGKYDIVGKTYDAEQQLWLIDLVKAGKTDAVDTKDDGAFVQPVRVGRFGSDGSDLKVRR